MPRADQTGIRKGLLKALAIGTVLALAMMPLSMHAQGKGGGKPGGGGGGGDGDGGGEPDYLYTLANVQPPAEPVRIHPLGMNNHPVVVGASYVKGYWGNSEGYSSPFLWSGGVAVTLPTLHNDPTANANAIADNGLIVGVSFGRLGAPRGDYLRYDPRAVWWIGSESEFAVGDWNLTFPPEFFAETSIALGYAVTISDDGEYVAFSCQRITTGVWLSVVAQVVCDGQIPRYEGQRILPRSGNAKGELVGNVTLSQWAEAVHFDANLDWQFMGRLGSGTRSIAESINGDSFAVGWATIDAKDQLRHAFIWHPDAGMVDLNLITDRGSVELIDFTYPGSIINNAGHIVARGKDGNSVGFVLLTLIGAN